ARRNSAAERRGLADQAPCHHRAAVGREPSCVAGFCERNPYWKTVHRFWPSCFPEGPDRSDQSRREGHESCEQEDVSHRGGVITRGVRGCQRVATSRAFV